MDDPRPTLPSPIDAFHRAASRVPAYRDFLLERRFDAARMQSLEQFANVPVLTKADTFQKHDIRDLCLDGELGALGSVLTSSGHSGVFAFGLTSADATGATEEWIDGMLDYLFQIKSRRTLLVNCLPMGVKVATRACTLAETSVRHDMVIGLVKGFGRHFQQIILVGETAFIKRVLETGAREGVDWARHRIHVIVGEEPLAENGRAYLEHLLRINPRDPEAGRVASSMGVAELGLNLFSEEPPQRLLVELRRALHASGDLRALLLGPDAPRSVPSIFTYDPSRIFVEFDPHARLLLTTLWPHVRVPLVRYATGDVGQFLTFPDAAKAVLESLGFPVDVLRSFPIVAISGRGKFVEASGVRVYPEEIKEGLYHDRELASLITANFRLNPGPEGTARVRIQLSPGRAPQPELAGRFASALAHYSRAPLSVSVEAYETFGSGMDLDYERKFDYLGP